jgi:hypothetical protein
MPHLPPRLTLALLAALLCLAACATTPTVSVVPTATTPPAPSATPTPVLAPTPATIPAGWLVLDTQYFSLAYPPTWTTQTLSGPRYIIKSPTSPYDVIVVAQPQGDVSPYCLAANSAVQHTTFSGLPMTYVVTGAGDDLRTWWFANAPRTFYSLQADDAHADSATQAQDTAILTTFRPDNADPLHC